MDTLGKLLFNLQTIAGIPKGKKLSTVKEFISVDDDSLLQPLLRWKSGEGRDNAVRAVCKEIRTTITISEYIMESRYIFAEPEESAIAQTQDRDEDIAVAAPGERDIRVNNIKKIRSALTEANYGVENICETYSTDANVLAYLKPLMGEIHGHVCKINKLLLDIGEYVDHIRKR